MDNFKQSLKTSYMTNSKADKSLAKKGYTLDKKLSNKNQKVFIDNEGNPNITFRGSITPRDWLVSDLAILTGTQKYDKRFQDSVKVTKEVKKKYGKDKPINITGHSLGGAISDYVNDNVKLPKGSKVKTYNKGVGFGDLFTTNKSNQTDYRTANDIVSLGALTQNTKIKTIKTSKFQDPISAHHLENI